MSESDPATVNNRRSNIVPIKNFSKRDVSRYRVYKQLSNLGKHARGVHLLVLGNDYIVRKIYPKSKSNIFWNEVYWLIKLSATGFTPRIIRVNPAKLTFWMTYCGNPVPLSEWRTNTVKRELKRMEQVLQTSYQVYHNDIKEGNVTTTRRGKLYLIDLGWAAPYPLIPGYGEGRWGDLHPDCFEDVRSKCIKLLLRKPDIWPQKV